MNTYTDPLRSRHQQLLRQLERIREVADGLGELPMEVTERGIDAVNEFLAHHLLPNLQAEEHVLYPVVQRAAGSAQATAPMSRVHAEVGELAQQLVSLRQELSGRLLGPSLAKALRQVLYSLYTLIRVSYGSDDEIYLPMLDTCLTTDEAQRLVTSMDDIDTGAGLQGGNRTRPAFGPTPEAGPSGRFLFTAGEPTRAPLPGTALGPGTGAAGASPARRMSRDLALKLCSEVREQKRIRRHTWGLSQCWSCYTFSKGDPEKMAFNNEPGYQGCQLINVRCELLRGRGLL